MDLSPFLMRIWNELYGEDHQELLQAFIAELGKIRAASRLQALPAEWYKDVVVYSVYVDLFNEDFAGLANKLPYLKELGVSCIWLLPILDSPGRDAGFDIRDFRKIRPELITKGSVDPFGSFLSMAHAQGIRVIFDIAINHTSEEHPWFAEARVDPHSVYRDYYIWSDQPDQYLDARIIFKGIEESNWKKEGEAWFFHRFFDFQPDLNYRNPLVLIEMSRNLLYWLEKGVDGFRADAIPYLWKEEGTDCENLPKTHLVVKFFRQVLDYVRPNTLLLAEACQKPFEVVKYFGEGDACHAGYHFPLMPQIFKSLAAMDARPVQEVLSEAVTPPIPDGTQWFTFLRCHDELSLELVYVSEEDRHFIHQAYCKQPEWDFREGQGVSARLAELMDRDPDRIVLAFSIMLTLPGTPVIYYGDEFGKLNDVAYYHEQTQMTGKDDSRFLVRGRLSWDEIERDLNLPDSLAYRVYHLLSKMVGKRNEIGIFGRGSIDWLRMYDPAGLPLFQVLSFTREFQEQKIMCIHNLGPENVQLVFPVAHLPSQDVLDQGLDFDPAGQILTLPGYAFRWIRQ